MNTFTLPPGSRFTPMASLIVDMPVIAIKVKLPGGYGLRMKLCAMLIHLAGWVGPHDIEVEIGGDAGLDPEGMRHSFDVAQADEDKAIERRLRMAGGRQ